MLRSGKNFLKSVQENPLLIGTFHFDWDIPCGYITFGTCGMSIAKIIKKKWMRKFVNDWRNKTYKQVNDEIRQQEWEAM